jgi:signal transduction histidine kinase
VDPRGAGLALALAAAAALPGSAEYGMSLGGLDLRPVDALAAALVAAQTAPLAVRRVLPGPALAVVGAAFGAWQLQGYPPSFAGLGLLVALYGAGAHVRRGRTSAGVAAAAYTVLAVLLVRAGSPERPVDLAAFGAVLAACWGAGSWVRARSLAEVEARRRDAERAAAGERERLARELHDVVSHHVTAMVVQADAAQYLLDAQPTRAAAGLAAISDTGRSALAELRHLLDALDGTPRDEPAGTAPDRLDDLVDRTRAAGQPVVLTTHGRPAAVPADVAHVVVRVVQEALTNAVRHAAGRPTGVDVRYGDRDVVVEVRTGGTGPDPAPPGPAVRGSARGLTGLHERVRAAGGESTAGPAPGGDFVVRARIPVGGPT